VKNNKKLDLIIFSIIAYLFLPLILILTSCPTPFNDTYVLQVMDEEGPQITITYPLDGTPYAKTVIVEGYVTDTTGNTGENGEVRMLSYEVLGTSEGGDILLREDNSFSLQVDTIMFDQTIIIKLTAVDWNGNIGVETISLINAGNDIPSFAARPGNHQVTLTWDSVPLTESYSIYYTTNGNMPSENYGEKIDGINSTAYTVEGLDNGVLHIFQLHAHSVLGEEKDNKSAMAMSIPRSSTTLAPKVTGEYKQLRVDWTPLSVPDWYNAEYAVYRSNEQNNNYLYMSTVRTNTFVDTDVLDGHRYYYKIKEIMSEDVIESMTDSGITSPFPNDKAELSGTCSSTYGLAVDVDENYAYVAEGYVSGGLKVIDINVNSPTYLQVIGQYPTSHVWDIEVAGVYAYLADGAYGLVIIDVSIPDSPALAGSYTLASICGVTVRDNYAYISDFNDGLKIIDVSPAWDDNPASQPFLVSSCGTPEAWGVSVSDNYAYVLDRYEGLIVVDITDPTQVNDSSRVAECFILSGWDVTVDGKYAYVSGHSGGLIIIDISNPIAVDKDSIAGICDTYKALHCVVNYPYAYIADFNAGLKIVDISNLDQWTGAEQIDCHIVGYADTEEAWGVDVKNDEVFIADGAGGLKVIQILTPKPSERRESVDLDNAIALAECNELALVVDYDIGLKVIDIDVNSQTYFQEVGSCSIAGARDVVSSGEYAYIAAGTNGLKVIDINIDSPTYLQEVGFCITNEARALAVLGDYVYIADRDDGIKVIDISNPESPLAVGFYSTSSANDIAIMDDYVYVADWYGGLVIIDVSNPEEPLFTGACTTEISVAYKVTVRGDYAYVADYFYGPRVVNISDPTDPALEWSTVNYNYASNVAVTGNYVYVTVDSPGNAGLFIFDIYNPESPFEIGALATTNAHDVIICGRFAFLADAVSGLRVIDLLNED
jgi:hypothetical protein